MAYTVIDDSSAHFQTALYTGTGSTQSITNDGNSDLQPDWVWVKKRNGSESHALSDSTRGTSATLFSDSNAVESSSGQGINSFNTDGFQVGTEGIVNENTYTFVGWQWKMNGGTTSTNSDGDINTTVQVNSDAGMSIVTYSPPNATARNIGHGLGAVPRFIIIRARNRSENWHVFHYSAGTGGLILDNDSAHNNNSVLGDTLPTSSVYKLGTDFRMNGAYNYVGYFFADVQGFSKFGKWTGNGSSDGPFVHTGFKPGWLMYKKSGSGDGWFIIDTARDPYNGTTTGYLRADGSGGEGTASKILELYSNGFKIYNSDGAHNGNGNTYYYAAFADNPFVTSGGAPATAR